METKILESNEQLPILKPILLATDFVEKIKGDKLNSDVMMLIAQDDNYVYFVSCLKEWNEDYEQNPKFIRIYEDEGIMENGDKKDITLAKGIDLSTIFKINFYELIEKIGHDLDQIPSLPYLGLRNQLEFVNKITENINEESRNNAPRIVIIRRRATLNDFDVREARNKMNQLQDL
ncbi:hypothetical protein NPA07_02825 [Mycoplasmopsis caviae]|uniref:Uncharacterized protein n=1 Tax=Mycoplasmopsis caviae TaxID=55603 RepID=A0A3P8KXP8_9BACT|nr:hypothetical protein [Mycoplasmopsis caviae]UUD34733.1 hypothetical protein NPA07_02825 [Mycoplasmopsis caviae]VDR42427.1 Uncharacterised protein [Mycoplasmopsis caviae]